MNKRLCRGFGLVEVIISLSIVLILVQLCLFVSYKNKYRYNEQRIHYSAMQCKYNLLQIIKSDSYFCEHPELYFNQNDDLIKIQKVNNTITIYIYFDDNNKVIEEGFFRLNAMIKCTVYDYSTYKLFYYSISVTEKVIDDSNLSIGGINHFYKMEKK